MQSVSIKYSLKWRFKNQPRLLKQVLNGCSIGYWIGEKFVAISKINGMVELIKEEKLPF